MGLNNMNEKVEKKSKEKNKAPEIKTDEWFAKQLTDFSNELFALSQTLTELKSYLKEDHKKSIDNFLGHAETIIKNNKDKNSNSGPRFSEIHTLTKSIQQVNKKQIGLENIPQSILISIVSRLDLLFSDIFKWIAYKSPNSISNDSKKLSFKDLNSFKNLKQAKDFIIESETETFLRNSKEDQLKWLEKLLGIKNSLTLEDLWESLIETIERRNRSVHSDCKVTSQYIERCKKNKVKLPKKLKIGDSLKIDFDYVLKSFETILLFGLLTGFLVFNKFHSEKRAKDNGNPHPIIEIGYSFLSEDGFLQIAESVFQLAQNENFKFRNEYSRKMLIINQCIVDKKHDGKKINSILSNIDEKSCENEFKIAIAALQGRTRTVNALIRKIGKNSFPNEHSYLTWPLFEDYRQKRSFKKTFKEVFGKDLNKV